MRIQKLKLVNFKPLQHSGITELDIEMPDPVQIIVGDNGSGKSSCFRELTPMPAIRSDYLKGGCKHVEITHNGHRFTLISDFTKPGKPHSFVMDGVELNESGATSVQEDLAKSELGWDDLVQSLCNSTFAFCRMNPSERRNFLLRAYPSDLTFIQDKYKKLRSHIRDLKANLKLLRTTQAELESKLIALEAAKELKVTQKRLSELMKQIDQELYVLERAKTKLLSDPAYKYTDATLEWDTVLQEIREKISELFGTRQQYPHLFKSSSITSTNEQLVTKIISINHEHDEIVGQLQDMVTSIEEYQKYLQHDIEDEKEALSRKEDALLAALDELQIDDAVPVIDDIDDLRYYDQEVLPDMLEMLESDFNRIRVWSSSTMTAAVARGKYWQKLLDDLNQELNHLQTNLASVQERYNTASTSKPPEDCGLRCTLKDNFERNLNQLLQQMKDIQHNIQENHRQQAKIEKKQKRLKKALMGTWSVRSKIGWFEQKINGQHYSFWLLNGERWESVVNRNSHVLASKLLKLRNVNQARQKRKDLTKDLEVVRMRLHAIEHSNKPAIDIVTKTISEKTQQVQRANERLDTIQQQKAQLLSDIEVTKKLMITRYKLDVVGERITRAADHQVVMQQVNMATKLEEALCQAKSALQEKLVTVDRVLKEQEHINNRLHEGTLPKLRELEKQHDLLSTILPALSPNEGIPHTYMVMFLNLIIQNVNKIISAIWSYEMQLTPLTTDKVLDYKFPVQLYGASGVPDISVCSDGQKEIIDLGWTIALREIRGWLNGFPVKLDEPDKGISHGNRGRVLELLATMVKTGQIDQLCLVNHHSALYTAFAHSSVTCLNPDNIVLPETYNEHTTITH